MGEQHPLRSDAYLATVAVHKDAPCESILVPGYLECIWIAYLVGAKCDIS